MDNKRPLISIYKDGSAQFGILDIDIKGKYHGRCKGFCRYIFQSLIAGIFVAALIFVLLLLKSPGDDSLVRYMILSSIGASTFLVFGAPSLGTSAPSNVFFGHSIAVVTGVTIFFLREYLFDHNFAIAALASVSLTTFFMIILDFEHPPAAGTALALAIYIHDPENIHNLVFFILIGAFLLARIHKRFYLKDGFKAMKGIDAETLKCFKHYQNKQGENILLTVQDMAKASPEDIYKALGENSKYFCHINVDNNFKNEYCPIFQMWIDQAKEQALKEQQYSHWTLRDLF